MKLIGDCTIYETLFLNKNERKDMYILTQVKVKEMLKAKYYLNSKRKKLHEQLKTLRQGNLTVVEYMNTFEVSIVITTYSNKEW